MWSFENSCAGKFKFRLNMLCNGVWYWESLSQEGQYWIEVSGYHVVNITFEHERGSGGKLDRNCVMRTFNCSIAGLHPQSPRHFARQPSARVSQILPQSRDCSCYVSRPILAPPPLWLQIHTDLCAHDFAHSPDLWHQPRLRSVTAPKDGDFVELILL
jgi:hypothetical protein